MADEFPPARDTDSASASTSPDWNNVPFDVGCARCGHDLRGQSEPVCPACKLEFDWADAVPIERLTCARCGYHLYGLQDTRCPECGGAFTWEEALDRYQRNRKPIFEYQWRKKPVRSFIGTWWLALRPWKMWKRIDLFDRPMVLPIFLTALFLVFVDYASLFAIPGVRAALRQITWIIKWGGFGALRSTLSVEDVFRWLRTSVLAPTPLPVLVGAAVWCMLTFLAMTLFQQSLRRARIRTAHLGRITVYSCMPILPVSIAAACLFPATVILCEISGQSRLSMRLDYWFETLRLDLLPVPLAILFAAVSITYATRRYLRLRHALGVAVAVQVIAVLATYCVGEMIPLGGFTRDALVALIGALEEVLRGIRQLLSGW